MDTLIFGWGVYEHSVILDTCGSQPWSVIWVVIFSGQHQFPDKNSGSNKNKTFHLFCKNTACSWFVRPYLKNTSEMKFHSKLFLMSLWRQWLSKISSNCIYEMQVIRTELLPRARNIYIRWYHSMFTPHCLYCGIDFFSQWAYLCSQL